MEEKKELKVRSIFKKIDSLLFSKIDLLKKSPAYTKLIEPLSALDDGPRKFISETISIVAICIFPFFIFIFFLSNQSLKNEFQTKKEIIQSAKDLLANSQELTRKENLIYSKAPIKSQAIFNT